MIGQVVSPEITLTDLVVTVATVGGIIFSMITVTLGFVIRATAKWAQLSQRVTHNEEAIVSVTGDAAKAYSRLYEVMREDRRATNERLTYLEHQRMDSR